MQEGNSAIPKKPLLQYLFRDRNAIDIYLKIAYQATTLLKRQKTG